MSEKTPSEASFLPLKFKKNTTRNQSWWAPVYRGLVVEPNSKHYRAMRTAIWLYLYLIIHADRRTGKLFRKVKTIAEDMGVEPATIRRWLSRLVRGGYVSRTSTGRAIQIVIQNWKSLRTLS